MSDTDWLPRVRWQASRDAVDDECPFRWGTLDGQYVAEWGGIAIARFESNGHVSAVTPAPGAPEVALERLVRGGIAAFARTLSGGYSMHAAAVAWRERALVCVGGSGAGKSTTTAELCSDAGVQLLSDDVAGIHWTAGAWHVVPSEPCNWLFEDGRAGRKSKVVPQSVATRPTRIDVIVSLRFDDALSAPSCTPLRGAEALRVLVDAPMRFDLSPEARRREFEMLAGLVKQATVCDVVRSRDPSSVAPTVGLLGRLLRGERCDES
jgi:hypothetical protein